MMKEVLHTSRGRAGDFKGELPSLKTSHQTLCCFCFWFVWVFVCFGLGFVFFSSKGPNYCQFSKDELVAMFRLVRICLSFSEVIEDDNKASSSNQVVPV